MYKAGAAIECVTPDEPLWMAGFAARTEPAKGKLSDLYAAAFALEDESGGRLVIASLDIIAITKDVAGPVAQRVFEQTGLPPNRVILAATHSHYAPEPSPDNAPFFKIPPQYAAKIPQTAAKIIDALVRVIVAALHQMQPAKLFCGKTTVAFAHNRRRDGARGGNPSKEDTLDHDVPVLWATARDTGRPIAILFGYACHNSSIEPSDGRYSGDWSGFACEHLTRTNAGAVPLFIPGCGADQNAEPRGTVELSQKYGNELADAIQQTITSDGREITGPIRASMEKVTLAIEPVTKAHLEAELAIPNDPPRVFKARYLLDQLNRGESFMTKYAGPLQAVRLGDQLLMILMSGEPVVDWSHKFKREFARVAPLVWVAGYCNDMYGYIPTRRVQSEGGYEGGRYILWSSMPASWTDDVEDRITTAMQHLVAKVT
jgi:neutral ceramidase